MPEKVTWIHALSTKLIGAAVALLLAVVALVLGSLHVLSTVRGEISAMNQTSRGRMNAMQVKHHSQHVFDPDPARRAHARSELAKAVQAIEERPRLLREGDPELGIEPATDPRVLAEIRDRESTWNGEIRPLVEALLACSTAEEAAADQAALANILPRYVADVDDGVGVHERVAFDRIDRRLAVEYLFAAFVVAVLAVVLWVARGVSRRARELARTAERIAAGDLGLQAPVEGEDELAALATSFNVMTAHLKTRIATEQEARAGLERLLGAVTETASSLASGAAEIVAATTQQASGAQEQATAVSQTVTTVDEVTQTADQAAQRARGVAEACQRSADIGRSGLQAVGDATTSMAEVREQVGSLAASILALAEQAQQIGEIIASVDDIAEQTNVLALNAGIEAARAGEHGRGFGVVAGEIKALADQSKKATVQVRRILGDVQKASNAAVMATEEGTKSVGAATRVVGQAGETIQALAQTIAEAAQAAAQIAASAGQQAAGMNQIHQAMRSIRQATSQNLASTRQQEKAAQDLNELGVRLQGLLSGFGR